MFTSFSVSTRQILVSLLVILFFYILWIYAQGTKFRSMVNRFPGPYALPFFGNAYDFCFNVPEITRIVFGGSNKYPRNYRLWVGPEPYIYLTTAEDIQIILSSKTEIDKSNEYYAMKPWLGNGLITSSGMVWRKHRKLLTPTFHFRVLESYLSVFNKQSRILIQQLRKRVATEDEIDILPLSNRCIFDVLCDTIMGVEANSQLGCNSDFFQATEEIKNIVHIRFFNVLYWNDFIFNFTEIGRKHNRCLKVINSYTDNVIKDIKEKWKKKQNENVDDDENKEKKTVSFVELLLQSSENGEYISDLEIRENVSTFMFAGHDTISASYGWVLYLLGLHPEIQAKVHEELDNYFGDRIDRDITSDDLLQLKYLDRTIKESLRRLPSVPAIGRRIIQDVTLSDGSVIPAGANVQINICRLHKNPNYYPNPEVFDPDRFLSENTEKRHPFAFIPFSGGPRNCIGQKFAMLEEKIVLIHTLHAFSVKSLESLKTIKPLAQIVLTARNGLKFQFTPRRTLNI